jgi:4-alpha-glucanotransferase
VTDNVLRALAQEAGIAVQWHNFSGEAHQVTPETLRAVLEALGHPCRTENDIANSRHRLAAHEGFETLPALITSVAGRPVRLPADPDPPRRAQLLLESGATRDLTLRETHNNIELPALAEIGYHRLLIGEREIVLAVAPEQAVAIEELAGRDRVWGVAAQVYGLRRKGDGGIGDAAAVATLAETIARRGGDALALSPVHALFPAQPERYAPYSPSSRLFLNPLYSAPELVFGTAPVERIINQEGVAGEFAQAEAAPLIDWPAASRAKFRVFRSLFTWFTSASDAPDALRADFARFVAEGGELLRSQACFDALQQEQLAVDQRQGDWHDWPSDLRRPDSAAVAEFARAKHVDVSFYTFLQWLADRSFAIAQHRAKAAGMRIGLISDVAVGMDPAGGHAWSRQRDILNGVTIGAPPDLFNPNGQQWGITTFSPQALIDTGFAGLLATIRAALRNAGGIRIDHAMGLQRLWLVPRNERPSQGAYLNYPLTDMLRLLALESQRHQAVIVGEDLGTVPEGLRDRLDAHAIYGMRVLWFEKDARGFRTPQDWDNRALAMTSTHDLPTVASWWMGADIGLRARYGVLGQHERPETLEKEREDDREALWQAFAHAGVAEGPSPARNESEHFADAAVRFIGRTASALALVPLEDIIGRSEQPNLPGTIDEYPNWRQRTDHPVDVLLDEPVAARRTSELANERPR